MSTKTLNTRMRQKADTTANWAKATTLVPLKGEIILYTDVRRFKVGDGTTTVGNLPWYGEVYADQAASATKATSDGNGSNIAATYSTKKHTHTFSGSGSTSITATPTGSVKLNKGDSVTYVTGVSGGYTGNTSRFVNPSTISVLTDISPSSTNVASTTHTHTYTPSGTVSLNANTTATGGTPYIKSITSTPASASGTITAITSLSDGSGSLTSSTTFSTGDIPYITKITNTAASVSTDTSTAITGISGGSGSLESVDTSSLIASAIPYVSNVSYTAPSPTFTYAHFSSGSPTSAAAPVTDVVRGGTKTNGITLTGSVTDNVLTLAAATSSQYLADSTTTSITGISQVGTAASLSFNTTATGGTKLMSAISSGSVTPARAKLVHTHTGASVSDTGSFVTKVTASGGTASGTTAYLHHVHTPTTQGNTASVVTGVTGGGASGTTQYFHPSFSGTTSQSTSAAAGATSVISSVGSTSTTAISSLALESQAGTGGFKVVTEVTGSKVNASTSTLSATFEGTSQTVSGTASVSGTTNAAQE